MTRPRPSPRAYAEMAEEAWSLCHGARGCQLTEYFGTPHPTGQTPGLRDVAIDVGHLLKKCDRSGYLVAVLIDGHRWEDVPDCVRHRCNTCASPRCRGQLADDVELFTRLMRRGGYGVE